MIELKSWPSGVIRFDAGILEFTAGGLRVAARDIQGISILPPKLGRVRIELKYRAGLDACTTSAWVEGGEEALAESLVAAVQSARG
ncbi:MAG: hypothetical protein R3A52_22920 [Polyangiales bacterium]